MSTKKSHFEIYDLSIFKKGDEYLDKNDILKAFNIYENKFNALKEIHGSNGKIYYSYLYSKIKHLVSKAKEFHKYDNLNLSRIILKKVLNLIKDLKHPEFYK